MAHSSCPKCGNHGFETVITTPSGSNFKLLFIQCSSCGCVIGVLDYYNIGRLLENLAKNLKVDIHRS